MMHEIKIDYVTPESIIPYHNNTKKHPDSEIQKLAEMIEVYGFDQPIVVDRNMVIIKGHGRLLAHKMLGSELIPIVIRDDLSPELVKASRIADNKSNESEWDLELLSIEFDELKEMDFDLELTGFDLDEIAELMPDDETEGKKVQKGNLSDRFMIPPFTVLNAREKWWQDRKKAWLALCNHQ